MTEESEGAPRPIDRGVARRQAFMRAAREVFLEQGFEAASVNEVVRRAGGSLATLYAQFGNKAGLFAAVLQDHHEAFIEQMKPDVVDHLPLDQALGAVGEKFTRNLLSRDNLAVFRILIGEGRKFPEELQRYVRASADQVVAVVANVLAQHKVPVADHAASASLLLELLRSRHHYRALIDPSYAITDEQLSQHVANAVRIFLHGVLSAR
ncbi:MAG: TetR/AcrR family transcriptional regulator [Hyphomonadaceae bacterium]|nr:TetR/AcrR family transcriptional regulator [Hyphomonadaceae bacterium]